MRDFNVSINFGLEELAKPGLQPFFSIAVINPFIPKFDGGRIRQ